MAASIASMLDKAAFSLVKPFAERKLNRKAREYIKELGERTNLPSYISDSAMKSIRMQLTLAPYSGEDEEFLLRKCVFGIYGENGEKKRTYPYKVCVFDEDKYAHIAYAASSTIRTTVRGIHNLIDSFVLDGFFGKAGEYILKDVPEVEPRPLEVHEKILASGEEALKKIKEFRRLIESESCDIDSFTFEKYANLYEKLSSDISSSGFLEIEISPRRLRKLYTQGTEMAERRGIHNSREFMWFFFPFVPLTELHVALRIDQEKGKILAAKNEDKILENLNNFYIRRPEEVERMLR